MCDCFVQVSLCFPGSGRGCPLQPVGLSEAGWRGPQAVDRGAGEHPHLPGLEAVSKRFCPAAAAQV